MTGFPTDLDNLFVIMSSLKKLAIVLYEVDMLKNGGERYGREDGNGKMGIHQCESKGEFHSNIFGQKKLFVFIMTSYFINSRRNVTTVKSFCLTHNGSVLSGNC